MKVKISYSTYDLEALKNEIDSLENGELKSFLLMVYDYTVLRTEKALEKGRDSCMFLGKTFEISEAAYNDALKMDNGFELYEQIKKRGA